MVEKFKRLKDENKILIMLAFFSISIGIWNNFKQLWLQDNNLDVTNISNILSGAAFVCAIFLIIFAKKFRQDRLKNIILISMIIKFINLILLYFLNNTGNTNLINISIIIDTIVEKIIILSIYPFIVTIKKDNKLYSRRKLVEYLFSDVGILIGGIIIGKTLFGVILDYNICLLIAAIFLLISVIIMTNIHQPKLQLTIKVKQHSIKYILKNKILTLYIIDYIIANIAMTTGLGLKMLMLTNGFNFSAAGATSYLLIVGLLADLLGVIILKLASNKNEYFSITIKFGIRLLLYVIAFFANNLVISIIAITWSILISTAYEDVSDAPYINMVKNSYQLIFTNYRYILGTIGTSIGLFFAGFTYNYGINYMLGLSAFFLVFQIGIQYILIYMRKRENVNKKEVLNEGD